MPLYFERTCVIVKRDLYPLFQYCDAKRGFKERETKYKVSLDDLRLWRLWLKAWHPKHRLV